LRGKICTARSKKGKRRRSFEKKAEQRVVLFLFFNEGGQRCKGIKTFFSSSLLLIRFRLLLLAKHGY